MHFNCSIVCLLQLLLRVLRLVALCGDDGRQRCGNLGLGSGSPFGFGQTLKAADMCSGLSSA